MSRTRIFTRLLLLSILALVAFAARQAPAVSAAPPTDLFISEYVEGSSNNKAIEIYNGTGTAVNLATGNYQILIYSNGSTSIGTTISLTGSVAAGDVYVVADDSSVAAILAVTDQQSTASFYNGDDAVVLRKGGSTVVDSIGIIGNDPGSEWGTGLTSTADNTLQRKDTICAGDTNTGDAFDPATEWNGFAIDTFTGLGSHTASCSGGDTAPSVTGTSPADNATNVAANTNITITFSEAVTISGAIQVVGSSSGTQAVTPTTSDNLTFTLDPANFTASETVTVTIDDLQVEDQDATDPPGNMAADKVFDFQIAAPVAACGDPATLISAIQGSGASSPMANTSGVTIEGVVVGDFQDTTAEPPNELNGYFVQEEDDDVDADPNTSEGIFVFEGANPVSPPVINIGDTVRVTGTVIEFGDVAGGTLTELTTLTNVQVCAGPSGAASSATVTLPVAFLSDYEAIENMAVNLPQELTVTEVFTLGRYGEVLLAADGRLMNPTHAAEPGVPAQVVRNANILRSIMLDDGLTNQNPDPVIYPAPGLSAFNTLRGGDTTTGLTGVMHFLDTTEDYRVQPTGTVTWNHENPRPADAPAVPGSLKVVGSNTLNYFTTLTTAGNVCGPANNQECRGANTSQEFTRQHDKLINMLIELNADIVGLNELENNSAASPANDDNDPVLESIVDALNAQLGAGTYDFIDTGAIGTDAIKVGLIYKPASVTPINNFEVLTSAYDPDFIDTRNRPVLAQTFQDDNGGVFTVAVAHLKSKGSTCSDIGDPDVGDLQGECNQTRKAAAEVMVDWFAEATVNNGDPDILLVGDLNSYAKEDPIDVFVNAGFVDLAATLSEPYSYVFDGEWGYLDYAMASPTLAAQVAGVAEWHVNADEPIALDYNTEFKTPGQVTSFYDDDPFRVSDHDPILVGLNLNFPDTTAPDVTINQASGQADPTNASPINFTVVFSEPVTGFATGDVTLSGTAGATTATVTPVTATTYTVAVSGMANDGTVVATIAAGVADDAAGNDNTASTSTDNSVVYDATAPDTTIATTPANPSNSSSASFTFSGDDGTGVGGVTFECRIDGGSFVACTSPQSYTGLSDGSHTFQVRAKDSLGNTDPSPAGYTWTIDTAPPTVTINQASGQADPTGSSPINFTVVFSEAVSGFATGDVALSGTAGATTQVVTQIAPNDGTTYNVAVSGMTTNGTVIATVNANVAQDAAGNNSVASTSTDNTVTYNGFDLTPPTVTINQASGQADPTSSSPINFTVVFSEAVTGFATGDVTLSGTAGATTATVTPVTATTYNVAVSGMTSSGTVIATIAAGVADDAAGNDNIASTSTDNTVTYNVPVAPTDVYVSTSAAGTVGALSYGSEDILKWNGSAWSVWFDGSAAGLEAKNAKHNINAIHVYEGSDDALIVFAQNARVVPGIPGKVDGMDIVLWNGSAFSLVFDGQDVGLTVLTQEKIDGLHELNPALAPTAVKAAAGGSCLAYYLISPAGNGKVTNYDGTQMKITGEDVLGFCATQLGSTTAGKWHKLLDGKAEGVKPNAITSISATNDGQTIYLTTKAAFNVDTAVGGHSMVYEYNMTTGQFSGPTFSAPAHGLTKQVDGLHVTGPLP